LHSMKDFAVAHDAEVFQRVAFGKRIRLDLAHFNDGRNVLARLPSLLARRFARLSGLAAPLLGTGLGLLRHGLAVDCQFAGLDLLTKLLADRWVLLRALTKQASVEGFHLLGEPLDQFGVLGELIAKRCVLLA